MLWRGDGHGHLARAQVLATGFGTVGRLAAVGDMTGDGFPDLMGQPAGGVHDGSTRASGLAGLKKAYPAYGAISAGAPDRRSAAGTPTAPRTA